MKKQRLLFFLLIMTILFVSIGCTIYEETNNASTDNYSIEAVPEDNTKALFNISLNGNLNPSGKTTQEYWASSNFGAHIWELNVTGGIFTETNSTRLIYLNISPTPTFHIKWTTNEPSGSLKIKGIKRWVINIKKEQTFTINFRDQTPTPTPTPTPSPTPTPTYNSLTVSISGPDTAEVDNWYTWTAQVSGATVPVTYNWTIKSLFLDEIIATGTDKSISTSLNYPNEYLITLIVRGSYCGGSAVKTVTMDYYF